MIDSIAIKYFETHKSTTIDFHPGVNVVTGESDEGKSGLVRAITLNAQNRPRGDEYRNDELDPKKKEDKLKSTEVGIVYKGTGLVVRARDGVPGGVNHYVIDNEEPLRAIGTDVPEEVREVTLMDTVNIQSQHPTEQYFLLADKPGRVAKAFNKIAGLTVMDDATKDINSQVRTCNSEIKVAKKEIDTRQDELKDTEWVPKAEKLAKKLIKFKGKMGTKQAKCEKLTEIIRQTQNLKYQLTTFDGIEEAKIAIHALNESAKQIEAKKKQQFDTQAIIFDLSAVDTQLSTITHTEKALKALKTLKNESDLIEEKKLEKKVLDNLLNQIDYNEKELKIASKELEDAIVEHSYIFADQACPTCGRKGEEI